MTALAKNYVRTHKEFNELSVPVKASTKIWKGAMVGVDATGYAIEMVDTAGVKFLGVAIDEADNSSGSSGDIEVKLQMNVRIKIACSSADQTWVGKKAYAVDDNTVALENTVTNNRLVGMVTRFISATQIEVMMVSVDTNLPAGAWASFTTTPTPASGSVAVQLAFFDANGVAMTEPVTGMFYISEVATGLTEDLLGTSVAVLTNGVVTNIIAKGRSAFITSAVGLLGMTLTNGGADSFWVVFQNPSTGQLVISDECIENA